MHKHIHVLLNHQLLVMNMVHSAGVNIDSHKLNDSIVHIPVFLFMIQLCIQEKDERQFISVTKNLPVQG